MSRKNVRRLLSAVLCLAFLAGASVLSYMRLCDAERYFGGLLQVRLGDQPLSFHEVERLVKDAGLTEGAPQAAYTAWTERREVELSNPLRSKKLQSSVIYIWGDYDSRFGLVEEGGCALTEEMAFTLFGTVDVVGERIWLKGRTFTVERLLSGSEEMWTGGAVVAKWQEETALRPVLEARPEEEAPEEQSPEMLFDVLDIQQRSPAFSLDKLMQGYGLTETVHLDYGQRLASARAASKLPLWAAAVYISVRLFLLSRQQKIRVVRLWEIRGKKAAWSVWAEATWKKAMVFSGIKTGAAFLGAIGLLWLTWELLGAPFLFPDRFLPSAWSDFSFWAEAAESMARENKILKGMVKYGPDMVFYPWVVPIYATSLLQSAVMWVVLEFAWRRRGRWHQLN